MLRLQTTASCMLQKTALWYLLEEKAYHNVIPDWSLGHSMVRPFCQNMFFLSCMIKMLLVLILKLEAAESNVSSSSTWSRRFPPLQKLLRSNSMRKLAQSSNEGAEDKSSPRAVLDGPEEREHQVTEECYSTSSHEVSRRGQNGLWRRLSDMKLWLPFLRTIGDDSARASDAGSTYAEDQKPAWRCFSFQEISVATNDFHPGKSFQSFH